MADSRRIQLYSVILSIEMQYIENDNDTHYDWGCRRGYDNNTNMTRMYHDDDDGSDEIWNNEHEDKKHDDHGHNCCWIRKAKRCLGIRVSKGNQNSFIFGVLDPYIYICVSI